MLQHPEHPGADLGFLEWWDCNTNARDKKKIGHAYLIKVTRIFFKFFYYIEYIVGSAPYVQPLCSG